MNNFQDVSVKVKSKFYILLDFLLIGLLAFMRKIPLNYP